MHRVSDLYGPLVLILTRAMPVFAEASVLIAGIHKLSPARVAHLAAGKLCGAAVGNCCQAICPNKCLS